MSNPAEFIMPEVAQIETADDLLGRLRNPDFVPVRSVPLFIGPSDLIARFEQLQADYVSARSSLTQSIDDSSDTIAAEIAEMEAHLAQYEVTFKVKGLPRRQWADLMAAHPPTPAQRKADSRADFNPDTFPVKAIAACLVFPAMTVEQVEELEDGDENGVGGLTDAQFNTLFNAVVMVNQAGLAAPKSPVAAAFRHLSAAS